MTPTSPRHCRVLTALGLCALLLAVTTPWAAAQPDTHATEAAPDTAIPRPVGFVNDRAGLMDASDRAKLESFLDQLKRKTGVEFAVLVVPTTAPLDPADYKVRVFERWGLGGREKDEGLLLLVAVQERRIWFETGYGLEGTLPDGLQSRIIRQEMTPRFRAGDWTGGITQAVLRTAAVIAKERDVALEWDGRELRYRRARASGDPGLAVVLAIVMAIVVLITIANVAGGRRRGRRYRGFGPWYGGWGGWGGGFGGGSSGGFGGGGGFGGFGGGSSGGGGGGGSW